MVHSLWFIGHSYLTRRLVLICLLFFTLLFFLSTVNVLAQEKSAAGGVAVNIEITDTGAGAGDIISIEGTNFKRSTEAYDAKLYGVIADAPIISIEPKTDKTKAVVTSGQAQVKVSNAGGKIVSGDYITSSKNAGVGQKATLAGYVIGKALGDYDKSEAGLVKVEVAVGFNQTATGGVQKGIIQSVVSDPSRLRLILAVILAIVVLVGGVVAFARLVNSGVTAIGRNPLARGTIMRGMIISGTVVLVIMILGLAVSVAIIFLGK